jgi:hypothetical protein
VFEAGVFGFVEYFLCGGQFDKGEVDFEGVQDAEAFLVVLLESGDDGFDVLVEVETGFAA